MQSWKGPSIEQTDLRIYVGRGLAFTSGSGRASLG